MKCPSCGQEVSFHAKRCDMCGQELKIYRRIISASNFFYNDGLEKAKVRDLSGAVESLKKSVKLNKRNTDARNLLGLVYYEMGEVVSALSEWVVSKHFQNDNNIADQYMHAIQSNPTRLEAINQTIKKYNSALNQAKNGNSDLAIMQLEKVVSLNPKFIRSYQLLALLYMKQGEHIKASKCLKSARDIDRNNPLTLYYMEQLPQKGFESVRDKKTGKKAEKVAEKKVEKVAEQRSGKEEPRKSKVFQPETDVPASAFNTSSYKEERFNMWPYLSLVLGAVLGIAVVYFLLVPTVKKSVASKYEEQFNEYTNELSAQSAKVTGLENEKAALEKDIAKLQEKIDALTAAGIDTETYTNFYKAIKFYMDGDEVEAAKTLSEVKETAIENKAAKEIYNTIKTATFKKTAEKLAEQGRAIYNNSKYEEAIELFNQALNIDKDNVTAIYFLGRCYHRMGNYDKAIEQYNIVINEYPDSTRVKEAKTRLAELQ